MLKYLLRFLYAPGKDPPIYTELAVLAIMVIICLTVYDVMVQHNHFDILGFGGGIAGPLGGHAAGAWADGQEKS